jgi:hypothetical protein
MNERDVLRGYRAANEALEEQPSAEARAAVLAAAARAVEAKPRAVDRMRHWRFPLAAAATVLISTIAVLVATRTEQEAARLAETPVVLEPETGRPHAPGEPRSAPSDSTAAAPPAEVAPPSPARSAAPRPSKPMAKAPEAAPPPPSAAKRSEAPSAPLDATAASGAAVEARSAERGEVAAGAAASKSMPQAPTVTTPAEPTPAQWIKRIVKLREAGRDEEADRELKSLRERYPDIHVPPAALRKPTPASGK